jgi:hypothetical protein
VLQGVGHVGDHAGHRVEVAAARAERGGAYCALRK